MSFKCKVFKYIFFFFFWGGGVKQKMTSVTGQEIFYPYLFGYEVKQYAPKNYYNNWLGQ